MWIFTRHGFYSAVCARQGNGQQGQPIDPDRIMVRARVENILKPFRSDSPTCWASARSGSSPDRLPLPHLHGQGGVVPGLAGLAEETNYKNFKSEVARHQGSAGAAYEDALGRIWSVMRGYRRRLSVIPRRGEPSSATPRTCWRTSIHQVFRFPSHVPERPEHLLLILRVILVSRLGIVIVFSTVHSQPPQSSYRLARVTTTTHWSASPPQGRQCLMEGVPFVRDRGRAVQVEEAHGGRSSHRRAVADALGPRSALPAARPRPRLPQRQQLLPVGGHDEHRHGGVEGVLGGRRLGQQVSQQDRVVDSRYCSRVACEDLFTGPVRSLDRSRPASAAWAGRTARRRSPPA